MTFNRRDWIKAAGATTLVGLSASAEGAEPPATHDHGYPNALRDDHDATRDNPPPAVRAVGYRPVHTLNGWTLPYRMNAGVKEFHLVAEEVDHEFAPGSRAKCWGYNGSTPGPTIEAVEGDRVRIFVTNHLGEPTTIIRTHRATTTTQPAISHHRPSGRSATVRCIP